MKTGMMNYISKFWRGYYPLLLVEVQSKDSSIEDVSEKPKLFLFPVNFLKFAITKTFNSN